VSKSSPRLDVYLALRNNCFFTHHQVRHLIRTHLSHLGNFENIFFRELKKDKEFWIDSSNLIAAMSMRENPQEAGQALLMHCWPLRNLKPECPFTCASSSASIVSDAMEFDSKQRRILWKQIEKILKYEESKADSAWDDRMIGTYLKIQKLI
tara:strand:+ start:34421 stop:34876 length:456 start_codon:yes stop_codon:yes gene_type:complete